jgi:hypothetical protein
MSGCIEKPKQNSNEPQTPSLVSPTSIFSPQQSVSMTTSQNQTETSPVTVTTIVTPHFTGTISYGTNQSSSLTEDQAWKYAEMFFEKHGIRDIQSSEVRPLGHHIWTFENKSQTIVWGFEVNRMQSKANIGGTITIDAHDGHVVDYAGFQ